MMGAKFSTHHSALITYNYGAQKRTRTSTVLPAST